MQKNIIVQLYARSTNLTIRIWSLFVEVVVLDAVVNRILECAKSKGLDQKALAQRIGIRQQAITEWKKGITSSYTKYIQQLADVLETTADYLLTGEQITAEQRLDSALAEELATATPEEVMLVRAYIQGLKAARKAAPSQDT